MYPLDLSLANIWDSWYHFRQGKKPSKEIDRFEYYLEKNLFNLHQDLISGFYKHGAYRFFEVVDNKRRNITVASVKDRIVHRLLYDYLVAIFDKIFIYDAWSCRKGKGLNGAIDRSQKFLRANKNGFVWRSDIKKFFDSVDQRVFLSLVKRRITDKRAIELIKLVVDSYQSRERDSSRVGLPIGNLTSQIFANIYLNELDRLVKHQIKPKAYLRYGDDFIVIENNLRQLLEYRKSIIDFLNTRLNLVINLKNDIIVKAKLAIRFLGVQIYPKGKRLNQRNRQKIQKTLNRQNVSSYYGLIKNDENQKRKKIFNYQILKLDELKRINN